MSAVGHTTQVTKAKVVRLTGGRYGIEFEFDDGYTDFAEVESKETAEFYVQTQMGQEIQMGVHPLLINADKADALRRK